MKIFKIFSFICVVLLLLTTLFPTVKLMANEINNELNNKNSILFVNEENNNSNKIEENDVITNENINESTNVINNVIDYNNAGIENNINSNLNEIKAKEKTIETENIPVVCNASHVGIISNSTVLDANYGFALSFIPGVTTVTTGGMTNYSSDFLMHNSSGTVDNFSASEYCSARLTSNSQKGNIWARYNNVGTYNGENLDVKITLSNWLYLQPANTSANSAIDGISYPTVYFGLKSLNINVTSNPAVSTPIFTYTFYKHGTNTNISVKGHATFRDIDNGEYLIPTKGFDSIYKTSNSNLNVSTSKVSSIYGNSSSSGDNSHWVTFLFSGSSIEYTYTREQDIVGNKYRDITKTASKNTRSSYQHSISSISLAPFQFVSPNKKVSKSKVFENEEYFYKISQYIPDNYYAYINQNIKTNFTIRDNIEINLIISNENDIKVENDINENKTSNFVISNSNNIITITPTEDSLNDSNFYNHTYTITIPVKVKNKSRLSNVQNKAETISEVGNTRNTLQSNSVNTSLKYKCLLNTEGINSSISESKSVIVDAKESNTFNVKIIPNFGYKLESIYLDEKEYLIDNLNKNDDGSYSLIIKDENILSNIEHNVKVVSTPILRDINVNKVWDDNNNQYKKRPDKIKIELLENEKVLDSHILNVADNENNYIFKNLQMYDLKTKQEINYIVREVEINNNDLHFYSNSISGNMRDGYTITNKMKYDKSNLSSIVNKITTSEITSSNDIVNYKIRYMVELTDVLGDAEYTIVDYLPYKINEKKSSLDGGIYNSENKTITWKNTIKDIDTYKNIGNTLIVTKNINIVYSDLDPKKDIITNYVDGTIKILTTNASDTVSSSADTKININGNLIVHHYLYENGRTNTKLVDDEEYSKKVGTKFLTKPNSNLLNDYKLLEVDGNEVGEYIEGKKEISYYYAKKTNVKVKYVDYYTNEPIENDELLDGYVGMKYTTTLKEFNNYKFFKDTNNTSGTMTYDNIEVIYYYVHTSTGYTVKHIDDITGDIIKEENYNDNLYQGDKYTTSPMEDNRYTLVDEKYPTNNNGILDKDNIIINYYYKKKAELKVIHINAITDDVLLEEDIVRGLEGDSYSTNEKNFKGFKYKNRTNNYEGKYSVKINNDGTWNILTEVIYYYIPQYSCTLITKGKNCTITEGESIIVDAKSNNCFTVNIKPDFGHTLESVILDNKEYPINDLILNNDKSYTLLIKDENILSNIEHIVQANANPILRDIRINKLWNDDNNKYNKRPNKVKIELLENETVIDTCILDIINKENTYTFSNLPKYNYKTQKEINYTIKETEIEENDLHFYTSEISGNMDEGYNITNTFHFDTPKISSSITKTATTEIKNSEDIIEYKLDYNAELENVLGNLSYTIVDYLPYKIDLEKSDINGGLYDEKENTITWNETIENIDTYKNNMNNLHISKELKLLYLDLDLTKENIQNKVESKLFVQNNGEISIANSSAITNINIYGNLTVHHYLYEKGKTKIKLIEDENYSEKVGTEFSVNPESSLLKNYNLIEVEGEEIGKYTEEKNEVSYYYEKIDEKNVSVLPRTGDIKNFKLKFCLIFIAIILYIYKIFNIHKIGRGVKK